MMKKVSIDKIKPNPDNPRTISGKKLEELKESIWSFQKMLEVRPLIVDENMVVLGGNQRLIACQQLGLAKVPVIDASDFTEEQRKEFLIKDNVHAGEFDWDKLANEWDEKFFGMLGVSESLFEPKVEPKKGKVTITKEQIDKAKQAQQNRHSNSGEKEEYKSCSCPECGEKVVFKF